MRTGTTAHPSPVPEHGQSHGSQYPFLAREMECGHRHGRGMHGTSLILSIVAARRSSVTKGLNLKHDQPHGTRNPTQPTHLRLLQRGPR